MKKLLPLLLSLLTLASCASAPVQSPTPTPTPASTPAATSPASPIPTDSIGASPLSQLSLEELAGQLLIVGIEGTTPGKDALWALQEARVGGIILFSRNVKRAGQLITLTNSLKELNSAASPLLLCVDEEGGAVSRMPPEITGVPSAYDFIRRGGDGGERGRVLAAECAAFGFNVDLAPVLDVWSNPDNTVIGKRAFSSDPALVREQGGACARAMMDAGIIPVVKHFPGHGDTAADSHIELPVVDRSLEELWQTELEPFRDVLTEGEGQKAVPAVMAAHILLPQLDPVLPASLSPSVVGDLLRNELGFDGVIFTDDLTMGAITDHYGIGEAAVLAVEAGCDGLLLCHGQKAIREAYEALVDAAESGRLSRERLEESAGRLLKLKEDYALTDAPLPPPDPDALNALIAEILP